MMWRKYQVEFLGKEGEWLSDVLNVLLQRGTLGGLGGFCDKCRWRGWIGVRY
jgi:hypothetical protein